MFKITLNKNMLFLERHVKFMRFLSMLNTLKLMTNFYWLIFSVMDVQVLHCGKSIWIILKTNIVYLNLMKLDLEVNLIHGMSSVLIL